MSQSSHSPQHIPPPGGRSTSGKAIAALVLGLIGLTGGGAPAGIVGLVLGYSAMNDINASRGTLEGEGMAKAGIVLGWISVVLTVLGCVCGGLIFLLFTSGAAVSAGAAG